MRDDDLSQLGQEPRADESEASLGDDPSEARASSPSLSDEIAAFIEDGKTYAEAEIAYQKARLAFTADRGKSAALFGIFALGFVHLALIALVVGAVIVLTPYVTALGATLIVAGVLLLLAVIMLLRVQSATREIGEAFEEGE